MEKSAKKKRSELLNKLSPLFKRYKMEEDPEICEMLDYICLLKEMKRRTSELYDRTYNKGKWVERVRFVYHKTNNYYAFLNGRPPVIMVDFWEKRAIDRLNAKNNWLKHSCYNEYCIKGFDNHIVFGPDNNHIHWLNKLNRINELGRKIRVRIESVEAKLNNIKLSRITVL